ncbi:hypothetical protein ACK3SF_03490 [Candidatus Nanosalina sp. VS9-1]|uniref:hypothetical protein n=1 Tax=Candidatus Nanosalina sp. VS9-1 TaxID=3388566 RepID=UPI0039E0F830
MDDNGEETVEEEFGFELEGREAEVNGNPANRRAGTHANANVLDEDELAREAQSAESEYGNALGKQRQREIQFRDLKSRLESRAGDENQPVNRFLADARETGLAEVDDEWELVDLKYLEEDGERIEFADEDQSLMEYLQSNSAAVDTLSSQVQQFTGLISNVSDRERERVDEIEQEIEQAEERRDERIEQAEREKEEEVGDLKSQVSGMSTSDLDESSYDETNDMWQQEWDDISGSFRTTVEEAESEYEERREELEEEKQEVRSDAQEQRSTLKDEKQDLVSERTDRMDELEEVHVEFSTDVIEYVEDQAESIEDLFITLSSLGNMRDVYEAKSVPETLPGSPELSQDQQGVVQDISRAANAVAKRALTRIDYLEDAVTDYAQAAEAITDRLDEEDVRVGTRLDEVVGLYDHLGLDDITAEDDYGIHSLTERVQSHVEDATGEEYDAVEEFREEIESMARMP